MICITCVNCNRLGHFAHFCPSGLEASNQHHMNDIKLEVDLTHKRLTNENRTGRNANEGAWMNSGMYLTQEVNSGKEEYVESDDNSMIVTFLFNRLHDSSRKIIEDGRYIDTGMFLNTRSI